jgi:enamine deaminase RidA (YjgF/YER057c/UK114 family)
MYQQLITSNKISPLTSILAGQIALVNANAITGLITSAQVATLQTTVTALQAKIGS